MATKLVQISSHLNGVIKTQSSKSAQIRQFQTSCYYKSKKGRYKGTKDYYSILGVSPHASQKQIKAAFYELSKVHHPDVLDPKITRSTIDEFHAINEAYETLGNPDSRKRYDQTLFHTGAHHFENFDMDVDGKEFFRRRRYKKPPPPMSGKTKHYNYDEYYRQHYGEETESVNQQKKRTEETVYETTRAGQTVVVDETYVRRIVTVVGTAVVFGVIFRALYYGVPDFVKRLEKPISCKHLPDRTKTKD